MILENLLPERLQKRMEHSAEIALGIIVFLLFLDNFSIVKLEQLKIEFLRIPFWIYLIFNAGAANVLRFFSENRNPSCPNCPTRKLSGHMEWECFNCGLKTTRGKK